MPKIWNAALSFLAFASLAACQTIGSSEPVSVAITNVTVIDPETKTVSRGRSVYVDGDRIVDILPARERRRYAAARTIDGSGKFLIPGLMDMHVHLFLPEPTAPTLNLLLANGVTGIREMSGDCWEAAGAKQGCIRDYRLLQEKVRTGEIAGPKIHVLASTMVMGPTRLKLPKGAPSFITPRTAEQARTLVRHLDGRGVDLIKTHDSIPPVAFGALMEEARALNLEVAGHIPFKAGSVGAARLGYRSIEHARDLLYDCSRYGPDFRAQESAFAEEKPGAARPKSIVRLQRTVREFDPAICAAALSEVARSGAFYTPTHVTREMEARAEESDYRSADSRKYVMPDRNKRWDADLDETAALPKEERDALAAFFRHGLTVTGLAHRAGIPIMAGTDANDTMIVPGFSLHRELRLLNEAGLSPMDVLRTATTVPAVYLRRMDQYGGISKGKVADLVLLKANPLDDIRNTSRIEAVLIDGRLFDRAALDVLLAEVEKAARPPA
jgi:hypothetical protein